MEQILHRCGPFNEVTWPGVSRLPGWQAHIHDMAMAADEVFAGPTFRPTGLPPSAQALAEALLVPCPARTAKAALEHDFFRQPAESNQGNGAVASLVAALPVASGNGSPVGTGRASVRGGPKGSGIPEGTGAQLPSAHTPSQPGTRRPRLAATPPCACRGHCYNPGHRSRAAIRAGFATTLSTLGPCTVLTASARSRTAFRRACGGPCATSTGAAWRGCLRSSGSSTSSVP